MLVYVSSIITTLLYSNSTKAAFFTWVITQVCKATIQVLWYKDKHWFTMFFLKTGGMPSSHAALVTSISVSFIYEYGMASPLTTLTYIYGFIVVRDAFGVRRSVGHLVERLNKLEKEQGNTEPVSSFLRYVQGHTPLEVIVGAIIGLSISITVYTVFS